MFTSSNKHNMKKFKKVYTLKGIKADPRVKEVYCESEGFYNPKVSYWIILKQEFICPKMQCHTIHEKTIQSCCQSLNDVITK